MSAPDPCSDSLALAATAAYEDAIERKPRTRDKKIISRMIGDKRFVFGSFIREDDFQKISAEALKDGKQEAIRSCRGRIVLIGGKWHSDIGTGELVDRYDTPAGPMQGMYLHANYIEALLDDRYQREVPILFALGFDLVVGGALYYFFHKADSTRGKVFVLGIFLAPLVASYIVFANLNLYLDFVLPLGACFVHLVVEVGRDYLHLRKPSSKAVSVAGGV
jgi:CHASE2 domain-containing sensor protein